MSKKLFIKTYGCQMNVYDSARMADVLAPLGYRPTDRVDDADMVILNTCHIREKASEKVFSELGRLKALKAERDVTIAVAGCVAQAEGAEIQRRQPAVDIVVGPQAYHRLPEMVARATRARGHVLDTDFPAESKFDHLPQGLTEIGPAAFLTVQEGCDKFCTFCVVPYTRGAEESRPVQAILAEAQTLVGRGAREITLLGQNVNAFHGIDETGNTIGLGGLIRRLSDVPGIDRLRYTTSHPRDMDDDLIAAHRDCEKLMPFLHLPVQSGSDRILTAMNRQHNADSYLRLIDKLRAARPDLALSSDFIVGFPGETDEDFRATLDLIRKVGFAQAYSFKYSKRPGTPAELMAGQVPEAVATERLAELQALVIEGQLTFNRAQIGQTLPVLFDRSGRRADQWIGRSPFLQSVYTTHATSLIGRIGRVKIVEAGPNSLAGELIERPESACAA